MKEGYQEIELKVLSDIFLNKWWLILSVTFTFALLAYFATVYFISPVYKADVTLFIGKEKDGIGGLDNLSFIDLDTNNQLITDYTKIASTRLVVTEVIKNLNSNISINDFVKGMSVTKLGESRLFSVSYKSTDPEFSAAAANALATQLTIAAAEIVEVKNIRVIDNAIVPQKPISPSKKMNTMVAGALGFVFSIFGIFIGHLLNNKVNTEEDVLRLVGVPVIGMIPRFKGEDKIK